MYTPNNFAKKKYSYATLSSFLLRAHLIMILVKTNLTYSVFIYNTSMRNVLIRINRSDHNSVFFFNISNQSKNTFNINKL